MYYDLDLVIRKQIRSTNQKSKCQHVVMPAVPPTWRGPRRRRLGRCLCCSGCQCRTAAATRNDAERRHAVFEVSAYRRECHCRARDSNYLIDRCYGGLCSWPFLATAGCADSAAGGNSRLREFAKGYIGLSSHHDTNLNYSKNEESLCTPYGWRLPWPGRLKRVAGDMGNSIFFNFLRVLFLLVELLLVTVKISW